MPTSSIIQVNSLSRLNYAPMPICLYALHSMIMPYNLMPLCPMPLCIHFHPLCPTHFTTTQTSRLVNIMGNPQVLLAVPIPVPATRVQVCSWVSLFVPGVYLYLYPWRVPAGLLND